MDNLTPFALAWLRQWRRRCCPPESVLHGPADKALSEHVRLCPWCRQDHGLGPTGFVPPDLPDGLGVSVPPQPGELWSIAASLAGWGLGGRSKGRYYNPPLVLIVDVLPEAVTVVQTCGETTFAAADDLPFPGDMEGFAQPWNRYTLRRGDLGVPFGLIFPALPDSLRDPLHYTAAPLTPGSLLWFFRQLEVESGYFFSSRAVAALMAAHDSRPTCAEDPLTQLQAIDPQALHSQLTRLGLRLPADLPAACDTLTLLALARPSDDALPLAAADRGTAAEYALNVMLRAGEVVAVRPLAMHIDFWQQDGNLLHVSGRLGKKVQEGAQPLIWLQTLDRRLDPLPGEFGLEGDFFWALFHVDDTCLVDGECLVRIVSTA